MITLIIGIIAIRLMLKLSRIRHSAVSFMHVYLCSISRGDAGEDAGDLDFSALLKKRSELLTKSSVCSLNR